MANRKKEMIEKDGVFRIWRSAKGFSFTIVHPRNGRVLAISDNFYKRVAGARNGAASVLSLFS